MLASSCIGEHCLTKYDRCCKGENVSDSYIPILQHILTVYAQYLLCCETHQIQHGQVSLSMFKDSGRQMCPWIQSG